MLKDIDILGYGMGGDWYLKAFGSSESLLGL